MIEKRREGTNKVINKTREGRKKEKWEGSLKNGEVKGGLNR